MFRNIILILSLIFIQNSFGLDCICCTEQPVHQYQISPEQAKVNKEEVIYYAAANNDISKIREFLAGGTDVNGIYACYTLLITAVIHGHIDLVRFLIDEAKADVNRVANQANGYTPLMWTALNHFPELEKQYAEIAQILIASRANIDQESHFGTALIHSVDRGNLRVMIVLLNNQANPLIASTQNKTAFAIASEKINYWLEKDTQRKNEIFEIEIYKYERMQKYLFEAEKHYQNHSNFFAELFF